MVGVHVGNHADGRLTEGIRFRGPPVSLADPRHPAIAADVTDVIDLQLPEREVAEISVVARVRMNGEECPTRAAAIPLHPRARSEAR